MERVVIHSVNVKPKEGITLKLEEEYKHYIVFYSPENRLNMEFLSAKCEEPQVFKIENRDEVFSHLITVAQFNNRLPDFLGELRAWRILALGLN